MPGQKGGDRARGGAYTFRVSDVVDVPLRGTMLRLRVVEGTPSMADLGTGATLRLRSPAGAERQVTVKAHAVPSGRASQARLDRVRELDVIIADDEAAGVEPVEIGWTASGPAV
jgi:hypothetical protein